MCLEACAAVGIEVWLTVLSRVFGGGGASAMGAAWRAFGRLWGCVEARFSCVNELGL